MKRIYLLIAFLGLPVPALAQRIHLIPSVPTASAGVVGTGIAAVVNDNIITTIDLDQRMRLAILSSVLPDNPEVRQHLLPQILRSLID